MPLRSYLQLIRWKNILLMGYLLGLLNWRLFPEIAGSSLENSLFVICCIAILAIMAGGNVINDIFDRDIDFINRPEKRLLQEDTSIESAKRFYKTLNVLGIGSGIWFSMKLGQPGLSFAFIVPAILLYFYSKKYKSRLLIGNLLVSVLITFPIVFLSKIVLGDIPLEVWVLSFFVFVLTLVREIIKDCEDIKGDYKYGCKTIPIVFGSSRTLKFTRFLVGIVALILAGSLYLLDDNTYLKLYILILLIGPLLWLVYQMDPSKKIINFNRLSTALKLISFLGVNSIYFI